MNIISINFLLFILIVLAFYYTIFRKHQILFLLASSMFFYTLSSGQSTLFLLIWLITNYFILLLLQGVGKYRFGLFISLIFADFLPIFITKYFPAYFPKSFYINTPLGISFITVMLIGYIIETYRKNERDGIKLSNFLLFNTFLAHVSSGPIARKKGFLDQTNTQHLFNPEVILSGIYSITIGIIQKIVIADRISLVIDPIFKSPTTNHNLSLLLTIYFFSFQIYFDFAGYSNIALGLGKLFGYDLIRNFNKPYLSKSVNEFWSRWHISLSTWLRDYVFISLGGSRVSLFRNIINILITFSVSGLWHGTNLTFLVWGLLHGVVISIEKILSITFKRFVINNKIVISILNLFKIIITFNILSILWVFFRSSSLPQAFYIISHAFTYSSFWAFYNVLIQNKDNLINIELSLILIIITMLSELFSKSKLFTSKLFLSLPFRVLFFTVCILVVMFFGVFGKMNFYYVKF